MKTSPILLQKCRFWLSPVLALLICCLSVLTMVGGSSLALPITHAAHTTHTMPNSAYTVSGTVFDDYNQNGTQDSREPGLNGVIVTAYDANNAQVVTTTSGTISSVLGQYTLSIPAGTGPVRVEFTNFGPASSDPNLATFAISNHTGGNRQEAFVSGSSATNTLNLGLEVPSEYCQNNPNIAVSCFTKGDQTNAASVLVRFPYTNTGDNTPPGDLANAPDIGTTFGLAYRSSTDNLFVSAFMRRHAGFKPLGSPGAIYIINSADQTSPSVSSAPFFDFNATSSTAGTDQHNPANNYLLDAPAFDAVGKYSLGGMALSSNQRTLYVMNLFDKKLYAISIGIAGATPVAGAFTGNDLPRPDPTVCPENDFRPFAVATYHTDEYVGAVCSAQSTINSGALQGDPSKLEAYVYRFTPGTGFVSTPVLQFALNYPRRCANAASSSTCVTNDPATWHPWTSTYQYTGQQSYPNYPQPMLTGIAFDRGDMVLGLRDRFGDQTGYNAPNPNNTYNINGIAAGQLLRACLSTPEDTSSGWTLENNALCGGVTTSGAGDAAGPGGGEYYYQDNYSGYHDHVDLGSVIQIPGFTGSMATVFDPTDSVFSGGVRTYSNANGAKITGYRIYNSTVAGNFGKANGLGGIAALCHSAPVEIGHRLWLDSNGNGIQDANEPPIVGATVNLYAADGTTFVQSTTTDSNGNYYFTVPPYVNYVIKVDHPADYSTGGVLANHLLLTASSRGSDILANSKAVLPNSSNPLGTGNYPQIAVTAPQPGENIDTYDIGFVPQPDLSITKQHAGTNFRVGQAVTYTLTVANATGPILAGPVTITDTMPAGLSNITVSGTNWSFTSASPEVRFADKLKPHALNLKPRFIISQHVALHTLRPHISASGTPIPDSPINLIATYTGSFPIPAGTTLSVITVTGTLTNAAVSNIQNTVTVTVSGDSNTLNNTAVDTVNVTPAPDATLVISHTGGTTCVPLGQSTSYTLTVSNVSGALSPIPTGSVTVSATLPTDLSGAAASGTGWTTSISGNTLTATYSATTPLAAGNSLPVLTVSGTVSTSAGSSLTLSGAVNAPDDSNSSNDSATDTINACPPPDLTITKTHGGSEAFQVGQNVGYLLTVSNVGTGNVETGQAIMVTDSIPTGLSNVQASGSDWSVVRSGSNLVASYTGSYPVTTNQTLSPIIVAGTLTSVPVGGTLTNTATVSTPLDRNSDNNSATDSLTVNPGPDLAITKTHQGAGPFQVGQTITYLLSVTNVTGSGSVLEGKSITVTDPIPTGLTSVTANGTDWTVTTTNNTITATYTGTFPVPGGTTLQDIVVSGQLTSDAPPTISNTATVSTPDDANSANNSSTDPVNVDPLPDLGVSLIHNGSSCVVNGTITYTLSLTNDVNAGPIYSDQPVSVSATLPSDLGNISVAPVTGWNISTTGNTITANYNGTYPIATGAALPPIIITSTLNTPTSTSLAANASLTLANDSNSSNNTTTDTIVICAPDLAMSKTHQGSGPFQFGQAFSYLLSVSNGSAAGPLFSGETVTVTDHLPNGLSSVSTSGTNWTIAVTNGILTATYAGEYPIATGATLPNIVVSGTLNASASPTLSNTATVSTLRDTNSSNDSSTDTVSVDALPDLTVSLTHQGTGCNPTGAVNETFIVNNSGSGGRVLSGPITTTFTLPNNLNNVTVTTDNNWQVSHTGSAYTLLYSGSYPVNIGGSLSPITVTGTASGSSIAFSATVTTATDSNHENDTSDDTIVICSPDLAIVKTHQGSGPFQIGQNASFILTVTNVTNSGSVQTGESVTVTDHLPTGLSAPTASGTNWTTTITNGILTANYTGSFPIPAGTTLLPITITGQLTGAALPTLSNTATVSAPRDTNQNNDTSTDSFPVDALPDLAVTLAHTGTGCVTHGTITYILAVRNGNTTGPALGDHPISVSATFPGDLSALTPTAPAGWNMSLTGNTLTAIYSGNYPILAGASLPSITIVGTLNGPTSASLVANATLTLANDANSDNNAASNTLTICGPDLAIVKTHQGSGPFQVGQTFSFILSVSNGASAGPIFAEHNIVVTDHLPASLSNPLAVGNGWTTVIANGILTATYAGSFPVPSGASLSNIVVSGQLTSDASPTLSNTATVSTPGDTNSTNDSSTDAVPVDALPDLIPSLAHSGTSCVIGGAVVTYTLSVSNAANAGPALGDHPISVSVILPSDLHGISAAPVTGWTVGIEGNTVIANYTGDFPIGAGLSLPGITITGTLGSPPTAAGEGATAQLTLANDANTDNNTSNDTLTVCGPDLAIVKTHEGSGPFQVGQTFSFILSVSNGANAGPVFTGHTIIVTDHLPSGLSSPVAVGNGWTTVIANGVLTATYAGSFPVLTGASLSNIVVSGQLTSAASPTLSNTATVSTPGDTNSTNDSSTDVVSVLPLPDLTLSLTLQGTTCSINGALSYTLTVSNAASAGPILTGQPVTVHITSPVNLSGMQVNVDTTIWLLSHEGSDWIMTYRGPYPVAAGSNLGTATITGQALASAIILNATVSTSLESDTTNDTVSNTASVCAPDLSITKVHVGSGPFQVGQTFSYVIGVKNGTTSGLVLAGEPITVTDQLPTGLSQVAVSGGNWSINLGATSFTATYIGIYPVLAGTSLPNIVIAGQLNAAAAPMLANTATVSTPRDTNSSNNTATDQAPILPAPDLRLQITNPATCIRQSNTATFIFNVTNDAQAGPITVPITLTFNIPSGLSNASFSGSGWQWTKNDSNVVATYTGSQSIPAGAILGSFKMTGVITKGAGGTVGFSATINVANDSHIANNTSYGKLNVCGRLTAGNGGTSTSGNNSGGSKGSKHGNNTQKSHSGGSSGTTVYSPINGEQGFPGLPPTGSDPE